MDTAGWMSKRVGIVLVATFLSFSMASPGELWAASGAKPIELSFALHLPPKAGPYVNAFLPWAKEVEKRTEGKLKIKFYLSQSLVKVRDAYNAVKMGVADMTWVAFSLNRGRFPLMSVMELPFLSPDTYTGSLALNDLYGKFPELQAEVKDVHLLSLWVSLPYEIHTVNKAVKTVADIQGMKLATQPGASPALDGLGAIPVTGGIPGFYTMLEKGVVDGTAVAWGAYKAFKLFEVTQYHTSPHLGGVPYCHVMNSAKWKTLSKELQTILTEVTQEMLPDILCQAVTQEAEKGIALSNERGHEIIELDPDQQKLWVASAKHSWENWAKEMEAKNLPGQAVLAEALSLVEKYRDKRN
jgi:TRAP-type C4-dicarboxylate transport system substrate-binding protein